MKIVVFTHASFTTSNSMPRFSTMLSNWFRSEGYLVENWTPTPFFYRLPAPKVLKKWLAYVDLYFVFSLRVAWRVRFTADQNFYVVTDQALGIWVPLIRKKPHAIHVHDFMALHSSIGKYPQNKTKFFGKIYQRLIKWGFSKGQNFIPISRKTEKDLIEILGHKDKSIQTIYNGLNFPFHPMSRAEAIKIMGERLSELPNKRFLLHVGGNQWYKNREGVLEIYAAYMKAEVDVPLLVMVGPPPTEKLKVKAAPLGDNVRFITGLSNAQVGAFYSQSSLLIFPSIAEGFGWPIAEAMACGCPVLTTSEPPMTEVGGPSAFYFRRKINDADDTWSLEAAKLVNLILKKSEKDFYQIKKFGLEHSATFASSKTLRAYEEYYLSVGLKKEESSCEY